MHLGHLTINAICYNVIEKYKMIVQDIFHIRESKTMLFFENLRKFYQITVALYCTLQQWRGVAQ